MLDPHTCTTVLPPSVRAELEWWKHALTALKPHSFVPFEPSAYLETDARERGWGGVLHIGARRYTEAALTKKKGMAHLEPIFKLQTESVGSLDSFFHPKVVAVIGATEQPNGVGRFVFSNLKDSPVTLYPVNPNREVVLDLPCFPNVSACPQVPDLAVIITPSAAVPGIVRECVGLKVKAIQIISAGFREAGAEGMEREKEILAAIHQPGSVTRILGPNSYGTMCPHTNYNGTFSAQIARRGNVAFVSQSGAICSSVLDYALATNIGFSYFASVGSMIDINWADFLTYYGNDTNTKAILLYMETLSEPREFLAAARETAMSKPIIVLKAGRTEDGAKAALAHTGSVSGDDAVLDAAFKRAGIVRVSSLPELFGLADCLCHQPLPSGPSLMICTHAGGPGVLATDAVCRYGGELAPLSDDTMDKLNAFLPPHWSHANPIDMIGSATPATYAKAMEVCLQDPNAHGVLCIVVPVAVLSPTVTAQVLKAYAKRDKPIFCCYMGGEDLLAGREMLASAGIPSFTFSDDACRMFCYMWEYKKNLDSLYQVPAETHAQIQGREAGEAVLQGAYAAGRTELTLEEAYALAEAYGLPTVNTVPQDKIDRADSYEIILKSHTDAQFGPVMLFGTGGELFDVVRDTCLGLPPLNAHLAMEMVKETKALKALKGVRGQGPVDFDLLTDMLVSFSYLVSWHKQIKEIQFNPILASEKSIVVTGAKVVLFPQDVPVDSIPNVAIRPYPVEYVSTETIKDGSNVTVRPLRPEDIEAVKAFHGKLSEETVFAYYHEQLPLEVRASEDRLKKICFVEYDRQINLIAARQDGEILAIARLIKVRGLEHVAKITLVVRDDAQSQGLGRLLVAKAIEIARKEGMGKLLCENLADTTTSQRMNALFQSFGFTTEESGGHVLGTLQLQ